MGNARITALLSLEEANRLKAYAKEVGRDVEDVAGDLIVDEMHARNVPITVTLPPTPPIVLGPAAVEAILDPIRWQDPLAAIPFKEEVLLVDVQGEPTHHHHVVDQAQLHGVGACTTFAGVVEATRHLAAGTPVGPGAGGDPAEPPLDSPSRASKVDNASLMDPDHWSHYESRRAQTQDPAVERELAWLRRGLDVARLVATWSKDPSTQVGAVLMDSNHRILSTGFNGFPRGVGDHPERYADRAIKYPMVVHAEANALIAALGAGGAAWSTLIITTAPCARCVGLAIQAGVSVVAYPAPTGDERVDREPWKSEAELARTMLEEAGIKVVLL